ncbi:MAG: thioredoxin fold domain-containing protein [Gammaproteobacteria bacterium]|jgi:thiol:disulfide interchange protein DsbC|nr:thioredoxin fold domain-containing protein [Gammaproteobacteria bacterium]MBQ0773281.1 thioredoxin fold domain-containing protein [Gammaproteobacteria bacterium]|tara:strand:- start:25765 stop:26499 length:735 start_codon:yes stop_codon:yes gene_type:complete
MRYLLVALVFLASVAQAADDNYAQVRSNLAKTFPGVMVTDVSETPVKGLLEVVLDNGDRLFVSRDGQYLLSGDMYKARAGGGVTNMGEQKLAGVRKAGLKKVSLDDMISYVAEDQKAEVFVFTDTSCGYCRKLHQHMAEYNDMGVTIHYLAFPRGGADSEAAGTMRAVWCAKDRHAALDGAKLKGMTAAAPAACKDPVSQEYNLGLTFGVRGTPAIYTPSGESIGGYLSPADMASALGLKTAQK